MAIQRALWVAYLVALVLLIGAIFQRRIAKQYRFFLAYLIVEEAAGIVLVQIPFHTLAYGRAYRFYEMAIVVFRAGAVAELFERVSAHFPVIVRIRFVLASVMLGLTALVSIAAVRPAGGLWQYPQTVVIYIDQFETSVLAVSLVLIWWFLTRFLSLTPTVRGNVALHWKILTIYFGLNGCVGLLETIWGPARNQPLDLLLLAGSLACVLAWIRGLKQSGETAPPLPLSSEEAADRRVLRETILQHVKDARREHVERL